MFDFQSLEQLSALTKNSEEFQKKGVGFLKNTSDSCSTQHSGDTLSLSDMEKTAPPAQVTPPLFLNLY